MPTYDYQCENGHRFEVFQSMKDDALTACTECGGKARRIIGPGAGFLFKGSGFYTTEHRSKEYKEKAKSESTSGGGGTTEGGGTAGGAGNTGEASKSGSDSGAKPNGGSGSDTKSGGDSGGKKGG